MIFALHSSILEIITQFAIINSIKHGSKNEKEKLMFKYCHSWYCPKKLVWKAHAGRFSPLFSLLLRKCLWGLERSLVCFLLDIIYTLKIKKKFKKKWAKSLNENSSQHFHTMVRKTTLEIFSVGKSPSLKSRDSSDKWTCGITSLILINTVYLFQCSIRILHSCIRSSFCLILL